MSRTFEGFVQNLADETGYSYDFLVERYEEVMDEDGDIEFFYAVSRERDW